MAHCSAGHAKACATRLKPGTRLLHPMHVRIHRCRDLLADHVPARVARHGARYLLEVEVDAAARAGLQHGQAIFLEFPTRRP